MLRFSEVLVSLAHYLPAEVLGVVLGMEEDALLVLKDYCEHLEEVV